MLRKDSTDFRLLPFPKLSSITPCTTWLPESQHLSSNPRTKVGKSRGTTDEKKTFNIFHPSRSKIYVTKPTLVTLVSTQYQSGNPIWQGSNLPPLVPIVFDPFEVGRDDLQPEIRWVVSGQDEEQTVTLRQACSCWASTNSSFSAQRIWPDK